MAGLATDPRFDEVALFHVDAGRVTAAAFVDPRPLEPVGFVVVDPFARVDVELDLLQTRNVHLVHRDLQLARDRLQIGADAVPVDVGHDRIRVGRYVCQHAAVQGALPGVVMLQVAGLADIRADIEFGLVDRLQR